MKQKGAFGSQNISIIIGSKSLFLFFVNNYVFISYNNYSLASNETLSITSEYSGVMQRHWKCNNCLKEYVFNLKERMQHEVMCQMTSKWNKNFLFLTLNYNFTSLNLDESTSGETDHKARHSTQDRSANSVEYHCSVCKETLYLTSVEILKHKRSHSNWNC